MPNLKEKAITLLNSTNVSLAADADTVLYTVPTGKRCILTNGILVVGADAGTSMISIGQNSSETDFAPYNMLAAINAAYDTAIIMPVPNTSTTLTKSYPAGTVIEARVSSNAGGAANTLFLYGMIY